MSPYDATRPRTRLDAAAIVADACTILLAIGAPPQLVTHGRLVAEAASMLLALMARLHVEVDAHLILSGAVLHDAGKTVHREELVGPGSSHEAAGERLLLSHGVDSRIAHCCVSHANWESPESTLEDLLVALADKLWKGVRVPLLEERVCTACALRRGVDRWEIYTSLEDAFDTIASSGDERLARSR